jgi:hypothetical protein
MDSLFGRLGVAECLDGVTPAFDLGSALAGRKTGFGLCITCRAA